MNTSMIRTGRNDGYDMFPAVFGLEALERLFDSFPRGQLYDTPQGYPSDIIQVTDESGNVTGYEVDVTLAGIPRENIVIGVEKDTLTISVEKVEKQEDKTRNYLRRGISQRAMQLRYGLHSIDKEKIKATLADGMLKVELPLAEEAKPKTITIG